jgi:hypothetical protein
MSESGDTTGIVMLIGVKKYDRSRDIRPESFLPTGVGHMTEVVQTIGVMIYLHYTHV